jgi:hypothetical protein
VVFPAANPISHHLQKIGSVNATGFFCFARSSFEVALSVLHVQRDPLVTMVFVEIFNHNFVIYNLLRVYINDNET